MRDTRYHGKPCKNCGGTEKLKSSRSCVVCSYNRYRAWRATNLDKQHAAEEAWRKRNPHRKNAECSRRRAAKRNQTAPNASPTLIQAFYFVAQRLGEETGVQYHVDHIVPLCKGGLHHQDNLQVITAEENLSKGSS